jgi:hypothetical protein
MNFRIPLLLASCLLFISFAGLAQGIKFNPTNKVEHVFYQYFLGHDKDKNFVLASNYDILGSYLHQRMNYAIQFSEKERIKLLTYNDHFAEPAEVELEFKHKVKGIAQASLSKDGNIVIIYGGGSGKDAGYYQEIFDQNGVSQSEKLVREVEEKLFKVTSAGLYCSDNGSWYMFRQGNDVELMDKDFKKIWKKTTNDHDVDFTVLNDGAILFKNYEKSSDDDAKSLTRIGADGTRKTVALKPHMQYFLDEDNNRLSIVNCSGEEAKFLSAFKIKECTLSEFNLNDLSPVKKYKIRFSDNVLLKVTDSKHIEKVKGMTDLTLQNVIHPGADKDPIVIFQVYFITSNSNTSSTGRTTSTTYYANFGDIIMVALNGDEAPIQKVLERKAEMETSATAIGEMFSLYHDGKIYLLFNNADNKSKTKYKFNMYTYTAGLENAGHRALDTYADHELYLRACDAKKYSDDKYFITGAWKKNVGSAFLTFEQEGGGEQ